MTVQKDILIRFDSAHQHEWLRKIEILPLLASNTYPEAGAKVFDLMQKCIDGNHRIDLDL